MMNCASTKGEEKTKEEEKKNPKDTLVPPRIDVSQTIQEWLKRYGNIWWRLPNSPELNNPDEDPDDPTKVEAWDGALGVVIPAIPVYPGQRVSIRFRAYCRSLFHLLNSCTHGSL